MRDSISIQKRSKLLWGVALALVALAWGTSYAVIKDTLTIVSPFIMMFLRFGFSTLLLLLIFGKRLKHLDLKNTLYATLMGFFLFMAFLFLVTGISYTTASKQSFIIGAYVLIVPFLAWRTGGKKPDLYAIVGASLATAGIGFLTLNSSTSFNLGDSLSLGCSFFFACHMVAIEKFGGNTDPIASTLIQFITVSILFGFMVVCFESTQFSSLSTQLTTSGWLSIGYLVIFATVVSFVVQNSAQQHLTSTSTALILTLESAFGSLFAIYFLQETMTFQMIIGCLIIFLGILTQETKWLFLFQSWDALRNKKVRRINFAVHFGKRMD